MRTEVEASRERAREAACGARETERPEAACKGREAGTWGEPVRPRRPSWIGGAGLATPETERQRGPPVAAQGREVGTWRVRTWVSWRGRTGGGARQRGRSREAAQGREAGRG